MSKSEKLHWFRKYWSRRDFTDTAFIQRHGRLWKVTKHFHRNGKVKHYMYHGDYADVFPFKTMQNVYSFIDKIS
jgi:hypothetical protein